MKDIEFGQFRFDFINECLWQGARAIPLRPKAFAVLRVLLEHPGQLVNKQQMLEAVWPGTFVGDAVLKDCIRQLREALNDDAGTPSYIETAHRRGYRFIGKISVTPPAEKSSALLNAPGDGLGVESTAAAAISPMAAATQILGRDAELATVRNWFGWVVSGKRQTVFITGEAGIGKTTLVQAFLEQAVEVPGTVVVRGQCLEHFGSGEAYLPVLDGFSRLCKSSAGARVLQVLREQAPSWLAHMSSLPPPLERDILQPQSAGAPRERMLREMAEAIDTLTEQSPLLLVLEDLHWSDYSTLDLISHLARRGDPARLMIIGTYRPVDVILASHPLRGVKRELQAHRLCHELPLEYLTEDAIDQYLAVRFPGRHLPSRLRHTIYRRTDGNPLFMVNLVEYLIDHNVIAQEQGSWKLRVECSEAEHGIPSSIKELIEKQIERLSADERRVLEAASATGMEFSTVAIAAGLDMPREWVDAHCEELARRHQFLFPAGLAELPDGTITPRYRFKHVLYREVPYSLIPAMRRAQIHQRIADRAVGIFRERASEIAAELAMHFEQSRDWPRALQYLIEAARTAARRSAHHEAAELSQRGLEVLKWLPETTERVQQEVTLRMILSVSLMAVQGFAADEMEKLHGLGQALFKSQGPSPQLFNLLALLVLYYKFTGQMRSAEEIAVQLLQIAETLGDSALVMEAHRSMGSALVEQGKCAEAIKHFNQASALYPANHNHPHTLTTAHDCKVVSECFSARALWILGEPDGAMHRMEGALAFAKELSHPGSSMFVAHFAAQLHQLRGETLLARQQASEVLQMADEYGLDLWQALGNIDMGWAVAEMEDRQHGIDQMQRGVAAYMATGAKLWCPYFLGLLADQLGKAGRLEEGLQEIARAVSLAEESGEMYALAELYRIKSELISQKEATRENTPVADSAPKGAKALSEQGLAEQNLAEPYFAEGVSIAKHQRTSSREVRAHHSRDRFAAKAQN
jgi:DNA-binding winged helix-turn-helix (wHTH) protein/predicted ATPase/energy-coupling factor transporter ATP-binding protein EcfA2